MPRWQKEAFEANMRMVDRVKDLATQKGCTAGQLALAWVHAQGPDVFPIPGTKRIKYLEVCRSLGLESLSELLVFKRGLLTKALLQMLGVHITRRDIELMFRMISSICLRRRTQQPTSSSWARRT